MSTTGTFLYPNVTSVPGQGSTAPSREPKRQEGVKTEFDQVFDKTIEKGEPKPDLQQLKQPLKFSAHATQRLGERKITLDQQTMLKVNDAIDKAAAKGVEEAMILTDKAALIVSIKNRTVITALDKTQMSGNVFTNIDGAVIV